MSCDLTLYWGNPGKKKVLEYMKNHNYKTLITSPHFRIPRTDYALDNGAYSNWKHDHNFQGKKFLSFLNKYKERIDRKPDWVAVPDKVAQGNKSLDFSLKWIDKIPDYFDNLLLVVQDEMDFDKVKNNINQFFGLFIGGTMKWKLETAPQWVGLAHKHNKICHIGRIGTWERIMWAERIKADSIDSTSWSQSFHTRKAYNVEQAESQTRLGCGNKHDDCKIIKEAE